MTQLKDAPRDPGLQAAIAQAIDDATHAFTFLKESGTLSASLTFFLSHRVSVDQVLTVRFPQPWSRSKEVSSSLADLSQDKDSILHEKRVDADTVIHAHTPYLSAWSLAHRPF